MNEMAKAQHRVALAGFVRDELTGAAIEGAEVLITVMPPVFAARLELFKKPLGKFELELGRKWKAMKERPDRTWSRVDGSFLLMDLPDGKYGLTVSAPLYGTRYGTAQLSMKVPFADDPKKAPAWPVIGLPATTVQGAVTSKKTNVSFARVRVQGSGESAIADATGHYVISRIEAGPRTLLVNAQGYKAARQDVAIGAPGEAQVVNINLAAEKG